jgi:hypothetical protein
MSTPITASSAKDSAEAGARRAANSPWLDRLARLGFVAKGLVYALIGILAFQVAMGDTERTDQKGALQAIAEKPGGGFVLWLMVVGFFAYALWRFSEAAYATKPPRRSAPSSGSARQPTAWSTCSSVCSRSVR